MDNYRVFVRADDVGRVISINSSAFVKDMEGMVEIDRGPGDRYHHAQGNYLPGPLMDARGIFRYKLDGGKVIERTAEEMQADVKPEEKSLFENRLEKVEDALKTITNIINKLGVK